MKDRADFARKGIARGRRVVVLQYADGLLFVAENPSPRAAQGLRDLRPDRVRRGRQVQRVREPAGRRGPARRHARLLLRPARRHRSRPRQRLRADARRDLLTGGEKPYEVEISSPRSANAPRTTRSTGSPTTARWPTSTGSSRWAGPPTRSPSTSRRTTPRASTSTPRCTLAVEALGDDGADARAGSAGDRLEVAVLDRTRSRPRKFQRITEARLLSMFGSTRRSRRPRPAPERGRQRDRRRRATRTPAG